MNFIARGLPHGWVLHPIHELRRKPVRLITSKALSAMQRQIVRERAAYFKAIAADEDSDLRREFADGYASYLRSLDWALTTVNDEMARRQKTAA